MSTLAGEKRKHDERRIVPWWLLLVGFGLGIVFTLGASLGQGGAVTVYSAESIPDGFMLTATQIIHEATLSAQAAQNHVALGELDPLLATATAIVQQATLQAPNAPSSP